MGRILDALRAGAKGFSKAFEHPEYEVAGRKVKCPHCGGTHFAEQQALLNTAAATFLHLDWADTSGTALICDACGRIEWFVRKPERIEGS